MTISFDDFEIIPNSRIGNFVIAGKWNAIIQQSKPINGEYCDDYYEVHYSTGLVLKRIQKVIFDTDMFTYMDWKEIQCNNKHDLFAAFIKYGWPSMQGV